MGSYYAIRQAVARNAVRGQTLIPSVRVSFLHIWICFKAYKNATFQLVLVTTHKHLII